MQNAIDQTAWVDIELSIKSKERNALVEAAKTANCQIVASQHDAEGTPSAEDIVNLVTSNASEGDLVKFCSTVNDHQDALQIVEAANNLLAKTEPHCTALWRCKGGDWGRLHAPILGQELVYATMRDEFRLSDKGP